MKRTDPLHPLCMLCPHAGDTEWVIRNVETGEIYPCCSQCFRAFALRLAQENGCGPVVRTAGSEPASGGSTPPTRTMTPSPCAQARTGRLPEETDDAFAI